MTGLRSATAETQAALAIAAIGAATILGAYFFQYVVGLAPCPLCLEQRIPYYIAIPLALIVAFSAAFGAPRWRIRLGFVLVAAAMLTAAGLGVYHAGIEWKFWPGPTECSGALTPLGGNIDLLKQVQTTSVVRCDEAAWRLFGISLAGYNALIAAALALASAVMALRPAPSAASAYTQVIPKT